MIKKIGIGVGGLLVVLIIFLIIGLLSLGSFVTPEFLVKQIESSLNVRANVKKVNINLFSALSGISIEGIQLDKRDSVADAGTPLSERSELKSALISLEKVDLGISFGAILKKEFRLDKLVLVDPAISLVLFENGSNNLSPLFTPPVTVNGAPNPALSPEALEKIKQDAKLPAESESKEPFSIKTLPVSISMGELGIKNGSFLITMKKTSQVIQLNSTNIILNNLDIVPKDLDNHNSVNLDLAFDLTVLGANKKEASKFILESGGKIIPFDKNSGQVNPAIVHDITIREGSFISGFAAFDSLAGSLPILNSLNIKMDKLAERAELTKDVNAKLGYSKGRVSFIDSPNFPTKNYDLKIESGTWIQVTNNTHSMKAKILATKEESKKAIDGIDRSLAQAGKGVDTSEIKKQILGKLIDGDRIALPFRSTGNIKSPNVTLGVELPSITGILTGAGTKAVKDAIKSAIPNEAKDVLNKFKF